ncbi:glycoside hydrolase family 3 protein [Solwaraspora sp. WMMD792]|uniref:glycoside hydrolase family 3 protein n=1 Tax=Solwaraspora sp. WMMD792 TaxID=3016099 RepID=UPI0024161041|nr:glycoside hydrolase family 3 protein [Solwaraspora sp. WMMD792]MDG4770432.1 glycoside hydrolase family 3 protein [Solwaraspora sp. WMMD792]
MSRMVDSSPSVRRMAATVLQPGFIGTSPPDWVRRWVADGLGAVVLFARNVRDPEQVAALTAALRAERPDVLVAIDEEAGDVTRIESGHGSSRPGNLALGAVDDPELTRRVAHDLGLELAGAGVTVNYAPVADVNSNPDNPVIGVRAFGDDPHLVARHTAAWIRGLQDAGVAACAKHFPGHGDTNVDSHAAVPRIDADRIRLDAVELTPFRAAIAAGTRTIMTGHLLVPAIDPANLATLSRAVLVDLLRDRLGFTGAVITDGIEMRAVTRRFGLAGATVRALAAGVDAVCVGGEHADEETVRRLTDGIVDAVVTGQLPAQRLAEAAERIRQLADWSVRHRRPDGIGPVPGGSGPVPGGSGSDTLASAGPPPGPVRSAVGLAAARRALRIRAATRLPLTRPAYVVEFAPPHNIAIGAETPWGIGQALATLRPGTLTVRLTERDLDASAGPSTAADVPGRPVEPLDTALLAARHHALVLVVRDLHRHRWMSVAVDRALAVRPDAVVVEMGVPVRVAGDVHLSTYGASWANSRAAAEWLAGWQTPVARTGTPGPTGSGPTVPGPTVLPGPTGPDPTADRSAADPQDPVVVAGG